MHLINDSRKPLLTDPINCLMPSTLHLLAFEFSNKAYVKPKLIFSSFGWHEEQPPVKFLLLSRVPLERLTLNSYPAGNYFTRHEVKEKLQQGHHSKKEECHVIYIKNPTFLIDTGELNCRLLRCPKAIP